MINLNDNLQRREIRIFISSTFRDMKAERDQLIKYVFPRLRRLCHARGVELTEVDLRWGVTEEQVQEGRVIETCLREIDRCRPYFIGLLGARYGWIPGATELEKQRRILAEFPWVKQDINAALSITEMEIQYGVLRNPEQVAQAFFYLRDPRSTANVSVEEDSVARQKLTTLKKRIREQTVHPHHDYRNLDELENQIVRDFTDFLDKNFPDAGIPSELERMRLDHAAFAVERLKLYIGGQDYIQRLDQHIDSHDPPIVITGDAGMGKSALLANWITHYQRVHSHGFVLYHFIGGAPDSSDHYAVMRRIMLEMRERFDIEGEVPVEPHKIAEVFPLYLAQTPHSQKWVLVLDALNQLEDKDNARWLGWLPAFLPENIRVIVSTLPGDSLEALEKRRYSQVHIQPLAIEARKRLITEYLKVYTKELSPNHVERIARDPESQNPLILRTLLDELRIFGEHDRLQERIEYYLTPQTPIAFFDAVLQRLEQDFESYRCGMVGEILSLIWVARRGLSEKEILTFTNIPPLHWAPLYNALENHLVSRAGLLDFFHDYLRQAIAVRYLNSEEKKKACHLKLADYFANAYQQERAIDELPYQLLQAKAWARLKDNLADVAVFVQLNTDQRKYELLAYWQALGKHFDLVTTYQIALETLEQQGVEEAGRANLFIQVARFFGIAGLYQDAELLLKRALTIRENLFGPDHPDTAFVIASLTEMLLARGEYAGAEPLLQRALNTYEKVFGPEHSDTAASVNNLAALYFYLGDYPTAEEYFRRALAIFEKIHGTEHPDTLSNVNNLATLLKNRSDYAGAEQLFRRALAIREKALGPEHPDTASSLNSLALLLNDQGDYAQAEPLFRRALAIQEKVLGPEHPDTLTSENNLALSLYGQEIYTEAEALFRHALAVRKKVLGPQHPETANSIENLAVLLKARGDFTGAEPLYRHALAIREKVLGPEHPDTANSLNNLASFLEKRGETLHAERFFRRALAIREKVLGPEHSSTAISMNNLAHLLQNAGDVASAESLYRRALAVFEKVFGPEHSKTAIAAHNLATFFEKKGDIAKSEAFYRRELAIREKEYGPEHLQTATSVNSLAISLYDQDNFADAELLFRRALAIREKHLGPEHPDTASSVNNLALSLYRQVHFAEAELLFRRALATREKVLGPEHADTIKSVTDLAILLFDQGNYTDAERLFRSALAIREKTVGTEDTDTIELLKRLSILLIKTGKANEGILLLKRVVAAYQKINGPEHPDTIGFNQILEGLIQEHGGSS